ncbi:hypothetical protein JOB18_027785 [Solea senegalensis]|uniref:Uncharacterized protein n=1 Tax=Solea senegalensis TaxID=28829 RepID=A0AAV6QD15_SOLSE|nr:hypothetical protein JOB18_027785 [Solea senegalensis]
MLSTSSSSHDGVRPGEVAQTPRQCVNITASLSLFIGAMCSGELLFTFTQRVPVLHYCGHSCHRAAPVSSDSARPASAMSVDDLTLLGISGIHPEDGCHGDNVATGPSEKERNNNKAPHPARASFCRRPIWVWTLALSTRTETPPTAAVSRLHWHRGSSADPAQLSPASSTVSGLCEARTDVKEDILVFTASDQHLSAVCSLEILLL